MNYISEIISGLFAVLVTVVEVRSARDRKRTEQRAAVRAKENRLSMKILRQRLPSVSTPLSSARREA